MVGGTLQGEHAADRRLAASDVSESSIVEQTLSPLARTWSLFRA